MINLVNFRSSVLPNLNIHTNTHTQNGSSGSRRGQGWNHSNEVFSSAFVDGKLDYNFALHRLAMPSPQAKIVDLLPAGQPILGSCFHGSLLNLPSPSLDVVEVNTPAYYDSFFSEPFGDSGKSSNITMQSTDTSSITKSEIYLDLDAEVCDHHLVLGRGAAYYAKYGTASFPPTQVFVNTHGYSMDKLMPRPANQFAGKPFCTFCKHRGIDGYTTHVTKNLSGDVLCPYLKQYSCTYCKNRNGLIGHTRS